MVPLADLKRSLNITSTNPYHDTAYYQDRLFRDFLGDEDNWAKFIDQCIDVRKQLLILEQGKYVI